MTEPREDGRQTPATQTPPREPTPSPPRSRFRPSLYWIVLAFGLLAINLFFGSRARTTGVARPRSVQPVLPRAGRAGHVKDITSKGTAIQGTFTQPVQFEQRKPTTRFRTEIPAFANNNALAALLQEKGVVVNAEPLDPGSPWWQSLLLGFGPTILFVFLLFWLIRRAGNVQNVLGAFGRSRARRYEPTGDRVTFADVAGIDEAKEELREVVDFLRNPDKYRRLGGRIPHGVLLSGPPGTGKTLLARAVAGEADVPFFSLAASEFVEAIVGVGRRPRARPVPARRRRRRRRSSSSTSWTRSAARGRRASAGFSGGNDEREQTLNQILTEMDGFDSSTSVIVIAATNRPGRPRPGAAPARPVRPPRRGPAAGPGGARGDPEGAHAQRAARPPTSTSAGSRPRRPAWSAPTSPTSSTRRRCSPHGATTRSSRRPTSPTRSSGSCSGPSGR